MATGPTFIFGGDTGVDTPQELARKRAIVHALMSSQRAPRNVGEGLSALGDGIVANVLNRRADAAEQAGQASAAEAMNPIMASLGIGFPEAPPAPGGAGPIAAKPDDPNVGSTIDFARAAKGGNSSGNEVFSGFMDTVKTGVTNPYALAAIAATGKHESAFSPENLARTWSDPSQSGEPGRAGGVMSWRGPRYQALAATGDLSPAGQAKFFLQEDPKLIAALNNAKSVEEAVSLMNNAWRFAGYDQPGGEAAARLATARSLLPTFQDSAAPAAPVQVASLDPSIGLPDEAAAPAPVPQPAPRPAPSPRIAEALTQKPAQAPDPTRSETLGAVPINEGGGPSLAQLLAASSNQWLSPQQEAIVQSLVGQRMKEMDPATALERRKLELELRNLENPKAEYGFMELPDGTVIRTDPRSGQASEAFKGRPKTPETPSEVREYQFYVDQERAAGREPASYNDWRLQGKKAGATSVNVGGGENKQVFDAVAESATSARAAAVGLNGIREARKAMEAGGIFGAGADWKLELQKVGASLGIADPQAIVNTETFRSAIAPQVSAMLKSTVGSANISNSDREFAEKAVGGNINLDKGTISRLLDIMERASTESLKRHQSVLDRVYPEGGQFDRERALFGVDIPAAPPAAEPVDVMTMPAPEGIEPEVWKHMPPEDRKLWLN